MKIIIYGDNKESEILYRGVLSSLEDLGLKDFIDVEKNKNIKIKETLNIINEPALIVEEDTIDFIDVICEGIVPTKEEIDSILISIIGGKGGNSCPEGGECGVSCFC